MQQKCRRGCLLWRHRWAWLPLPSVGRNSVLRLQRSQMQTWSQHGLPSRVAAASVVSAVRVLPFLVRPVGPSAVGLSTVASATSPMGVPMEGSARTVSGTGDVQVAFQLYRYLMPEAVVIAVVGEVRYFQHPPSTHPGHGRA